MNEVKTMVQMPLDLLEKLIEHNNHFLFQQRWENGASTASEKNAAEYASIEAVSVEAEKCKESQLQVMYHREFVPADNYDGLLKQARALQTITKTQQASLAFARKDAYDLSLQLCRVSNDRLNSELEANQALTNEVETLRGALNNLRAHAMDMGNDVEIPMCVWDVAMDELDKIGG